MEEDLLQLLQLTIRNEANPLLHGGHQPFCTAHGIDKAQFCDAFALLVAKEFAHGELSYGDADVAMNRLTSILIMDTLGLAWDIYLAFDAGEYGHSGDPDGTISWQKYTLPSIMDILARHPSVPRSA